jgi:hypothetical protein
MPESGYTHFGLSLEDPTFVPSLLETISFQEGQPAHQPTALLTHINFCFAFFRKIPIGLKFGIVSILAGEDQIMRYRGQNGKIALIGYSNDFA